MKNKLYVPANIFTGSELWNGFSVKSGIVTGIFTAVAIVFAVAYCKIFQPESFLGVVFAVMLVCAVSISLQTRIENNMSMVDYLQIVFRYGQEQQTFKYVKKEGVKKENG